MNKSIKLFTIFGISIKVHITFVLLPALVGFTLLYTDGPLAALRGVILILIIFCFVTSHELTHSLVAKRFNIKVKDIMLLPIGGVASMQSLPEKPRQEFLIAIAGPIFNLVLAAILFYPVLLIINNGLAGMRLANIGFDSWKSTLLYMFWVNPLLAFFNLLPAFPMDGGRALRAFLAQRLGMEKATGIAVFLGHAFAIIFGFIGIILPSILLIIIAFFVYMAATQEQQQVNLKHSLREYKVADILNRDFTTLKPDASLSKVLELSMRTYQHNFPVVAGNKLLGILDIQNVMSIIQRFGADKKVGEVMSKNITIANLEESLNSVYNKMVANGTKVVAVMKDGILQGIITLEDIARIYSLKSRR